MSSRAPLKQSANIANSVWAETSSSCHSTNGTTIYLSLLQRKLWWYLRIFLLYFFTYIDCQAKLCFSFLCITMRQLPVWSQGLHSTGLHSPLSLAQIPCLHLHEKSGSLPTFPEFSEDLTFQLVILVSICCFRGIFCLPHSWPLRLLTLCTPSGPPKWNVIPLLYFTSSTSHARKKAP